MKSFFMLVLMVCVINTAFSQSLVAAEYFFDADPGPGKGFPISVGSPADVVNFAANIPENLSQGFHWVGIRAKDSNGNWSLFERRNFYLTGSAASDMTAITAAEFFIDRDPGPGKASPLNVLTSGYTISQLFSIPIPADTSAGKHLLAIRVRDQQGNWSLFEKDSITVGSATAATITCPSNKTLNSNADVCAVYVDSIEPMLSPSDISYTYTLTGATTGSGTGSASGKWFNTGITTVNYTLTNSPATNCSFTVTVNTSAAVSILPPPTTTICSGTQVNFTAMPQNGGYTPTYQWKRNGINVGTNSRYYSDSTLNDGDSITVEMQTSLSCASPGSVKSNAIVMKVTQSVIPSISIISSATTICPGQQVTFTATAVNGGTAPRLIWRINSQGYETDNSMFKVDSLKDGDTVSVVMYSNANCALYGITESNNIVIKVNTTVTPTVTIAASQTSICSNEIATFTATPTNEGSNPAYEWTLNNNAVGTNSTTYVASALKNGDVVKLTMQSSLACASPMIVSSNSITMIVTPPSLTFYRDADGDGYGDPTNGTVACSKPGGYVSNNSDCDDSNPNVHPGAIELCNGIDDNCDGQIDEGTQMTTWYRDADGDGYGSASITQTSCTQPAGYVSNNGDCDDNNAAINPGHSEICGNGVDDNCNGIIDENCTTATAPVLMIRTYPVKEGDVGQKIYNAIVALNKPTPVNATVHYTTSNEDAKAGLDYVASSGILTIQAGDSTATLPIRIIGDVLNEGNERFDIKFSQPANMVFNGDSVSTVMIIDDDHKNSKSQSLIIPTVTRRNQIWMIPDIGNFKNEVLLMDANGQVIHRFVNYQNNKSVGSIALGLYFYRIQTINNEGEIKYYSGRLLVTE